MEKALIILSAILMLTVKLAFSQAFSGKTNDVFLNYKSPTTSTTPITLPEIQWTTPNLEYSNSQSYSIVIEAFVHSDIELKSIKIMISDGSTVRGEKPVEVSQARDYKIKQSIMLQDGQNVIDIIAENSKGGKVSSSRTVLAGKDAMANAVSADRKDYVLLFATDEYDNWNDLVNPIDDARSLVKILSEKYGFETDNSDNVNEVDNGKGVKAAIELINTYKKTFIICD